jgi:hypothetical protein
VTIDCSVPNAKWSNRSSTAHQQQRDFVGLERQVLFVSSSTSTSISTSYDCPSLFLRSGDKNDHEPSEKYTSSTPRKQQWKQTDKSAADGRDQPES